MREGVTNDLREPHELDECEQTMYYMLVTNGNGTSLPFFLAH
jgi:hypothetical protein